MRAFLRGVNKTLGPSNDRKLLLDPLIRELSLKFMQMPKLIHEVTIYIFQDLEAEIIKLPCDLCRSI